MTRRHLAFVGGCLLGAAGLSSAMAGCSRAQASQTRTINADTAVKFGNTAVRTAVGPVPGGVAIARPENPYTDATARTAGRLLFNQFNCAGCHGDHAGGGMGPSLRDGVWRYGDTDAQIFVSIADGRSKGMPAWGVALTDEQIWKLVAYLKSLRTPNEPEPPR